MEMRLSGVYLWCAEYEEDKKVDFQHATTYHSSLEGLEGDGLVREMRYILICNLVAAIHHKYLPLINCAFREYARDHQ